MRRRQPVIAVRAAAQAGCLVFLGLSLSCTQLDARDILVSSRNTNSIKRFDRETGAFLGDFVAPGAGGLAAPQDVLFTDEGQLLVTGRNNTSILEYDRESGDFRGAFSSGYTLRGPTKVTRGPDGYLYVSQWDNTVNKIVRFSAETGEFVDEFTATSIDRACGHAWDADGNLYVASFGSQNVPKFGPDGAFLGIFASAGLSGPVNLWFDAQGDLLVLDWTRGAVVRFDSATGESKGDFIGGLTNAEGFLLREDGNILICDWTRNLINEYDAAGNLLRVFTSAGSMRAPNAIAIEPEDTTPLERRTWGIFKMLFR